MPYLRHVTEHVGYCCIGKFNCKHVSITTLSNEKKQINSGSDELLYSFQLMLAVTKTVSVEFALKKDPIICILLHPGTVDTDLSRPFQRNVSEGKLFTKEFSVQKLLGIINNAKKHDNGKFFAWDGQEVPW